MHVFYRNRLAACYLGASHIPRSPNRFTGLDPNDDFSLKDLSQEKYDGPYPVFNASLSLVKKQDLAWQERKAESFVMTPLCCGYDVWLEEQDSPTTRRWRELSEKKGQGEGESVADPLGENQRGDGDHDSIWTRVNPARYLRRKPRSLDHYGYVRTEGYAFRRPWHGPRLGLAMAISGAAASPNMGFYSKMPLTFLMTVFNIRLGQWLGNPRDRKTRKFSGPPVGLMCLLRELLGQTDDDAAYVYLSDGGHFDIRRHRDVQGPRVGRVRHLRPGRGRSRRTNLTGTRRAGSFPRRADEGPQALGQGVEIRRAQQGR